MRRALVGVSGSVKGHPGIEWALDRAEAMRAEVQPVHVVDLTGGMVPQEFAERAMPEAERRLRAEADHARHRHPGVTVRAHVASGSPGAVLFDLVNPEDLLVIGSHRANWFGQEVMSRRAVRLAASASCSVIVVPAPASEIAGAAEGVVVGVDGSERSLLAVEFAAWEADRLGEKLSVVNSWSAPEFWLDTSERPEWWPSEPQDADRLILAESVAGLASEYPDLVIGAQTISAPPARGLYAASAAARLLVVGSRGRHGVGSALLGSVSEQLVSAPPCPVAVICGEWKRPGL